MGVSEHVLASTIRIATNPRAFSPPVSPDVAVEYANTLLTAPMAVAVRPGRRHWPLFAALVVDQALGGNDIPDAYLAALALEHGATFVTRDRGFRRFPSLRVLDPLDQT